MRSKIGEENRVQKSNVNSRNIKQTIPQLPNNAYSNDDLSTCEARTLCIPVRQESLRILSMFMIKAGSRGEF